MPATNLIDDILQSVTHRVPVMNGSQAAHACEFVKAPLAEFERHVPSRMKLGNAYFDEALSQMRFAAHKAAPAKGTLRMLLSSSGGAMGVV